MGLRRFRRRLGVSSQQRLQDPAMVQPRLLDSTRHFECRPHSRTDKLIEHALSLLQEAVAGRLDDPEVERSVEPLQFVKVGWFPLQRSFQALVGGCHCGESGAVLPLGGPPSGRHLEHLTHREHLPQRVVELVHRRSKAASFHRVRHEDTATMDDHEPTLRL